MTQQRLEGNVERSLNQIDTKRRGTDVERWIKWIFHSDGKGPVGLPEILLPVHCTLRKEETVETNRNTGQDEIEVGAVKFEEFYDQSAEVLLCRASFIVRVPFPVLQERQYHHLK